MYYFEGLKESLCLCQMNVGPLLAIFARCFCTMENLRRWIVFGVENKVSRASVHVFIQEIKFLFLLSTIPVLATKV